MLLLNCHKYTHTFWHMCCQSEHYTHILGGQCAQYARLSLHQFLKENFHVDLKISALYELWSQTGCYDVCVPQQIHILKPSSPVYLYICSKEVIKVK